MVFADDEQKKTIESSYTYTSYENLKDNFKEEFPKLKNAYVLNDLSKDEKSQLESALIKPMLMVSSIDSMDKNSKEYQERFGNLPADMDIYQVFSMMDANTKKEMTKKIDTQIDAMGESTMLIAGGNGVRLNIFALGADVRIVFKSRYILSFWF